jgi:hypothetical protein
VNKGDVLSPLLFSFPLGYAIRKVKENQDGLKMKGICQLLACIDDFKLFGENINAVKKNT